MGRKRHRNRGADHAREISVSFDERNGRKIAKVPIMTDNTAQKTSAAYRLPALDREFLLGDSMRGVRLLLEYEKAEERLRAWVVRSTIVVFGSARARPADPNMQTLEPDKALVRWYEEARRFGRLASERGGALIAHDGLSTQRQFFRHESRYFGAELRFDL